MLSDRGKKTLRVLLGFGISVVFLALALRGVHWPEVWAAWREARWSWLLGGLAMLAVGWGLASVRWYLLLAPAPKLRIRDTLAYLAIGFFANTVLPLRMGEVARATLIGRQTGLGIARALGSVAIERVFDLLALLSVTTLLSRWMDFPVALRSTLGTLTAGAAAALVAFWLLALHQERLHRLEGFLARVLPPRWAQRGIRLLVGFASGVSAIQSPWRLLVVGVLSLSIWLVGGFLTLLWVRSFHMVTPWYAGLFVLVLVNLGSAIPSAPGYVGVYHYMAVLALSQWVPQREPALAYAFGTHALNMLANIVVGGWFLLQRGVHLREVDRPTPQP